MDDFTNTYCERSKRLTRVNSAGNDYHALGAKRGESASHRCLGSGRARAKKEKNKKKRKEKPRLLFSDDDMVP